MFNKGQVMYWSIDNRQLLVNSIWKESEIILAKRGFGCCTGWDTQSSFSLFNCALPKFAPLKS